MEKTIMEREQILAQYIELTKKLSKFPSAREVQRFICSERQINKHFGKFNDLKLLAIDTYPELKELYVPVKVQPVDIENYRIDLEKGKRRKGNKKAIASSSTLDYIAQFSDTVFSGKVAPIKPIIKKSSKTDRVLNLVISDIHIGSDLNKAETGSHDYGPVQEARRMAAIVQEVINYKPQYRESTELEVLLLGDIIQNQLHDARDGAPLAEQACRAIHVLTQALQQLAANFKQVRVRCATGNHGRNTARHHDRATLQKWDSIETIIYYGLKKALEQQKNIEFHIPLTPYGTYEVFGQKILYTHGDTVLNPGYPGKSINVKGLETQLNSINAALPDANEVKVAVVGHVHTASLTYLANGSVMLTNGALIEPDQYAVSIGLTETQTGQYLFESVPGYAIGDARFIRVRDKQDKDKSLDSIITPWKGL